VSYVDDAHALAQSDPQAMLAGEQPHVIDEWQLAPAIWNTVRHAVDRKRGLRGAWLLTGSSTPLLNRLPAPARARRIRAPVFEGVSPMREGFDNDKYIELQAE
ncbi:hypothetical protein P0G11_13145, partial [Adlercreutzia rubneri]|nr:hypothetical protein [Adlercreutzia rubneri]